MPGLTNVRADTWTEMKPPVSPPARDYTQMVYVPEIDRSILFGGVTTAAEEPLGDTWAYDYESNTWTELTPLGSPSSRGWHAMALDPADGSVLMFGGGEVRERYLNDIWRYDPVANTWSQID